MVTTGETARKRLAAAENAAASRTAGRITVRMFCQGLGDCFLITIPQERGRDYTVLIDCGVAMGTAGETELMKQVAQAIGTLIDGKAVDLLVVTHEHRDHVSGFVQAEDELIKLGFQHVWFAWTERRGDKLADELRAKHAKERMALTRAFKTAAKALASTPLDGWQVRALERVLAFHGPIPAANGKTVDVAEAMEKVAKWAKSGSPKYLMPGEVLALPGAAESSLARDVRVFVLGPPHDGPKLRRINPRKKNPETYEKAHASFTGPGMSWAWAAAMSGHAAALNVDHQEGDASDFERAMPFDTKWRTEMQKAKCDEFFKSHYFNQESQRRIDGDWLWRGAQELALRMDSYTNNTSLVLALELPKSKKILLFPGDAQVGNWLSWHEKEYKTDDGRTVTAADLLARTVLYKVAHHGSHNATLRQQGLELMTHPELVAMIPVEADAVKRLGYGEMPFKSLLRELEKRTDGRVLQLDKKWPGGKSPGIWNKGLAKAGLAREVFKKGADGRALYIEYAVADQ